MQTTQVTETVETATVAETKVAKVVAKRNVKKTAVRAAVIPVVSAKTKTVFLKAAKANGVASQASTMKNISEKKIDNLEGQLRTFAKENGDARVWNSRVAIVQPNHLSRALVKQAAFWERNGFKVVNAQ